MKNIDKFLNQLLLNDSFFIKYWNDLPKPERKRQKKLMEKIEKSYDLDFDELTRLNKLGYYFLEKYFFLIPQKEFSYIKNINGPWKDLFYNDNKKNTIKNKAEKRINEFLRTKRLTNKVIFYGGIKSIESINSKISETKRSSDYIDENIFNTWDIIRFRIVTKNLNDLYYTSISIWEFFYTNILRCRNYYYQPMNIDYSKHFKGVNYIVSIDDVYFEIQVLTKLKELNTFLDYHYLYKKNGKITDINELNWLKQFLLKCNLFELESSSFILKNGIITTANKKYRSFGG